MQKISISSTSKTGYNSTPQTFTENKYDTDTSKTSKQPTTIKQTLHEFLFENDLLGLKPSLLQLEITMNDLYEMNTDDIDELCQCLNLNEYPKQEILFRSAINQLQDEHDSNGYVTRSATARSISIVIKDRNTQKPAVHQKETSKDYDHLVKLVTVGDAGIGKSNLVVRFCDNTFDDGYVSTIGVDFKFRTLKYGNTLIKLQVWDTAGQERFRSITSAYYRSADGLLLCYDITNKDTFNGLSRWIEEIRRHTQNFVILVGCKLDIANEAPNRREVSLKDIQKFADQHNLLYIEVSAKSTENIDELFFTATDCIMRAILADKQSAEKHIITVDAKQFRKTKNRKCCV